jgi:hypothetical protein
MGNFLRIRCLVPASVMIEDLSVRLAGKGCEVTVLTSAAEASYDLRDRLNQRQVTLIRVGPEVWPVAGPVVLPPLPPRAFVSGPSSQIPPRPQEALPAPSPAAAAESPEMLRVLNSINRNLEMLLLRPSPPPAEVVAAHVRAIAAGPVPEGLPGAPHPQFIPSTILPTDPSAGGDIKVTKSDVSVGVDASVAALKELKKRK